MPRSAILAIVVLVGCGRTEPTSSAPPPAVSSSVGSVPPLSAVSASASAPASASASPDAEPAPPPAPPIAGFPVFDGACSKDSDCGTAFFDDHCCSQCKPRVGSKAWVKKVDTFCVTPRDAGGRACPPTACSWAFGAPRCVNGACASR